MKPLALLFVLSVVSLVAHATDGVVEINAAKIAGVFPHHITQPGSYRLTSNLSQPDANTDVIVIDVDGVTLDLNGFAISGANTCSQPGGASTAVTCTGTGTGVGVSSAVPRNRTIVRNGTLSGIGGSCVAVVGAVIDGVHVDQCGYRGLGAETVLRSSARFCAWTGISSSQLAADVQALNNGGSGIAGGAVRHSVSYGNHDWGISGNLVTGNTSQQNGGEGISLSNGLAIGNMVGGNVGSGIAGNGNSAATQNVLYSNGGNFFIVHPNPVNSNLCDGAPC